MDHFPSDFFVVALVAALAPLVNLVPSRFRLPVVVVEILLGILVGPEGLGLAAPTGMAAAVATLGLAFLLFMVGMEIDFQALPGRAFGQALGGWLLSFGVAVMAMAVFRLIGLIQAPAVMAGVALSTTALGILMPILRDEGLLATPFGDRVLTAAVMGEFGPMVVISLLLIPTGSTAGQILLLTAFGAATLLAVHVVLRLRDHPAMQALAATLQGNDQLPVRACIALLALLAALAAKFGLSMVMGAFAAGLVVGEATRGEGGALLRQKLDAIGFGLLIPAFFIVAGMRFDLAALWASPLVPIQLAGLLALMVAIRSAPLLLFGDAMPRAQRLSYALYSATGLPLLVIVTEIGVASGLMRPDRAAVLVCAGMISVFLFPLLAGRLRAAA